ncbi:MAG TPA: PIN domain nuclease [Vicinamibacteria bacterium]|nr:PIN domain nuclease [Vicinamibacteria bacterium]
MILVDTSAWIEFLRNTDSPVCNRVDRLLAGEVATCDAIRMEVLAGARDEAHLHRLRRLLARAAVLPMTPVHYEQAASIYRHCRREGETVRKLMDCLIAAVAISADVPILHLDSDFDAIERHTELRVDAGAEMSRG